MSPYDQGFDVTYKWLTNFSLASQPRPPTDMSPADRDAWWAGSHDAFEQVSAERAAIDPTRENRFVCSVLFFGFLIGLALMCVDQVLVQILGFVVATASFKILITFERST